MHGRGIQLVDALSTRWGWLLVLAYPAKTDQGASSGLDGIVRPTGDHAGSSMNHTVIPTASNSEPPSRTVVVSTPRSSTTRSSQPASVWMIALVTSSLRHRVALSMVSSSTPHAVRVLQHEVACGGDRPRVRGNGVRGRVCAVRHRLVLEGSAGVGGGALDATQVSAQPRPEIFELGQLWAVEALWCVVEQHVSALDVAGCEDGEGRERAGLRGSGGR